VNYFYSLICILLIIAGCKNSQDLNIVRTNIGKDATIKTFEDIYFVFDRDVVDLSKLEENAAIIYIKFEPAIQGVYTWKSERELVFTPSYGSMLPVTEYHASLTAELVKNNPGINLPENNSFNFNTGKVEFDNVDHYWDADKIAGTNILNISFKLSIPFQLNIEQNLLSVFVNDKLSTPENISILSRNELGFSVNLKDIKKSSDNELKIVIKPGLTVGDGPVTKTKNELTWTGKISSIDEFKVTLTETSTNTEQGDVTYYFNHSLNPEIDYSKLISCEPKADYSVELFKNRLLLVGNFEPGQTYKITLNKNFVSNLGTYFKEDDIQFVQFNQLQPLIQFVEEEAIYLPSKGSRNVAVKLNAVKNLYLSVYKIYENNIMQLFNTSKVYEYYYDESEESDYYVESYNTKSFGDLIYNQKVDLNSIEKKGNAHLLKIDFKDYVKDKGVYVVRLIDSANLSLQTDKILTVSDLGIIAKTNNDDLFVSVNSLENSNPVQGAKVRLISENNQIIDEVQSNADGVVYFRNLKSRKDSKIPKLVKVEISGDVNYLYMTETTIFGNSAFDNLDGSESTGYKAFIYGDRELYRPGDSLFIAGIVRDENRKTLKQMPVVLQLIMPNSKPFREFSAETDDNGGFAIAYKIPENIITGSYRIKAVTSAKVLLGESKISIEQFIPERLKLTIKPSKENYKSPEVMKISALAENLFGTPAQGRNYDADITFRQKQFKNRDLQNYTFELQNTLIEEKYQNFTGETDNSGNLQFEYPLNNINNLGNVEAIISLTVFDESSRPVKNSKIVPVQTQPYFFGIGKISNWLNVNTYYEIPLVAVGANGESAGNVKSSVKIIRKFWQTVARKSDYNDYVYYENEEREETVYNKEIYINGKNGKVGFYPQSSGVYEVRVSHPYSESYVSYDLFAYSYGYTSTNAFKVSKEGYIDIYAENEKYQIGDKAKLMFRTPFNGRLIVTIERGGIIENYTLTTVEKTAELNLDIKDAFLPNIYVSAILIKPIVDVSIPINVAYGYLPIKIDKKSTILPVTISANTKSRSSVKQTVRIKTLAQKNINVTIAVVDEGIHQIKRTKTPDPHSFFYEKMALGVSTYDVYRLIFPELKSSKLSFGGDEGSSYSMDNFLINKFADERIRPLAFWSGILKTNSSGEAQFDFELPKFSGSARISVVAYSGESFGKADTNMIISDPLILSSAIPRFLAVGDEAFSSVNMTNTTNKKFDVTLNVNTSGPLKINNLSDKSISVPANSEKRVQFSLKALDREGLGEINITAKTNGETQTENTKLPIRFTSAYTKYYESGTLSGNMKKEFNYQDKFETGTSVTYVTLSKLPIIEFLNGLDFLFNYPYGCMEQTVSKAFPLLYFPELSKVSRITTDKNLEQDAARIVMTVIDRTKMLQLPDGGWGMWESEYNSHWWTTCYAVHFLISARNAGYKVEEKSIEKALSYLKGKAANSEMVEYRFTKSKLDTRERFYPKEPFYSLFVLALAGKSDYGVMNFYKNKLDNITEDSKILLACAFRLAGDNGNYKRILDNSKINSSPYNIYPNSAMGSAIRDLGISLYSIITADPSDGKILSMTKQLGDMLRNNKYLTTQEAAFGFMALGKALNVQKIGTKVSGYANDGKKEISRFGLQSETVKGTSYTGKLLLASESDGNLFYFINSLGSPKHGVVEFKDNYIKVRRTYFGKNGNEIKNMSFRPGDEIIVRLSIQSTAGNFNADDIVITDLLPAGLEVQNPRLSDIKSYKWIKSQAEPKHFDYRDDRVNIYLDFTENSDYYYTARAVITGKFSLGPVTASAMYNSDIFSISGGGFVNVNSK
jgi:uncharacterized protein YfaS (alpha-2-macroglobulin family)